MDKYYPQDYYRTPEDARRSWSDLMMLNSRWAFYLKYLKIMLKYRTYALENRYNDEAWAQSSIELHRAVEKSGGRIDIAGLDNVREHGEPVVFVSNHMSTAETQLLPGIIEPIKRFTFVVKESLMTGPVFGPIMRARYPVAVSQIDPRKDMQTVLVEGSKMLAQGCSVLIFPQGERTTKWNPETFNSLGIKLAKRANVRILPVALKTDFWGNGRVFPPFGQVKRKETIFFKFGKALAIEGNGKKQHQEIIEFISAQLRTWGM